jgi:hypothetical protein
MYDVFVSFTRTGHPGLAKDVKAALKKRGLSVFKDEDVPAGEGISSEIIAALNESRIMVVVYSESYNRRWACQWELIRAYLTGAAEGSGARRILVINPEAGDKHIFPADIADMKYLRPDQLDALVEGVKLKLAVVTEPMGTVKLPDQASRPSWQSPDVAGAFGFTGRFGELWELHNALSITDRPLTAAAYSPPVAVITGMPGIGKTYLARAYGWLFYALYPGGVHYLSVNGSAGASRARDRFAEAIRQVARRHGIVTAGQRTEQVIGLIADHVSATVKPELWIVDDLPADLDAATLAQFVIPASPIRTILIAPTCPGGVQEVNLAGLNEVDGLAVLRSGRPIGPADEAAARSIVRRLGGHPLALATAAGYLRGLDGLVSYSAYDASLATAGPDPGILASISRSMGDLTNSERTTIALAGVLGNAIPTVLISTVLAAAGPGTGSPDEAAARVIKRLGHGGFAETESAALRIHPLVIQAATQLGPPVVPLAQLATVAARKLTSLLADQPDDQTLIETARVLAQSDAVDDARSALALGRQVAAYAERAGDLAQAAAFWHQVASSRLSSNADEVAAALACVANAEFDKGVGHARHALGTGLTGDLEIRARWALAAGLDGLADFDEAGDLWTWLARATWTPPPSQRVAFEVARARAMLARGQLTDARSILDGVLTVSAAALVDDDQRNAARIELARLLIWTSKERDGRTEAESVVSFYRDRNTPGHAQCLAAEMVWAEATFALGLFEFRPDKTKWQEARQLLDRMTKDHPLTAGPHSPQGPAAAVLLGLVLVWLGKPGECVERLLPALPLLEQRLGSNHPLPLRAQYALSLAYCQLDDWGAGADILAEVWPAQRRLIGPGHPDTLRSQLQYGIALKFANRKQDALSAKMIDEVWSTMPKEVGRLNDLNAQLMFARGLRWTPYPMLRGLLKMSNWLERLTPGNH